MNYHEPFEVFAEVCDSCKKIDFPHNLVIYGEKYLHEGECYEEYLLEVANRHANEQKHYYDMMRHFTE